MWQPSPKTPAGPPKNTKLLGAASAEGNNAIASLKETGTLHKSNIKN
jgi:hypothetical protein